MIEADDPLRQKIVDGGCVGRQGMAPRGAGDGVGGTSAETVAKLLERRTTVGMALVSTKWESSRGTKSTRDEIA